MTRARDLSRLSNPTNFTVDSTNNRLGLNSTSPDAKLDVIGIVSATAFYGDGSNLEGVASAGLGTALNADQAGLDVIYFTDKILGIGETITITVPSSADIAYTQYQEISVTADADLIISPGDELVPDILGIGTNVQQPGVLSGNGGRVRTGSITDRPGTGAPQLTFGAEVPVGYGITGAGGINIAGVVTASSFDGAASGLTGTPDITVRNITGVGMTLSGTLNYEDVTNVDAVGIVTAQSGVRVLGAGVTAAGVSTFHNDLHVAGVVEKVAAATTYQSGNDMVLELDVTNTTTYRYTMPSAGNIGIVSFKNMPADRENGTTVTVLFTQNSSAPSGGIGNTQPANGIGTHCTVAPFAGGSALTGLHTAGLVGSSSTVTLSTTASDVDFVSFFVHYTGGTNTDLTSYKVYVTSNGNFRFGTVGI